MGVDAIDVVNTKKKGKGKNNGTYRAVCDGCQI